MVAVVAVVGGGWWWAVVLLPTVFTCFQMLPNESKVYHFDLILNALPVRMPIQVPIYMFFQMFSYYKRDPPK